MELARMPRDTASIVPVSCTRHGGRFWRRFRDYGFARTRSELPLALAETDALAASFPILFRETASGPVPVVLLDPAGRGEVPVVGQDGRWCAPYVPAALRAYPFDMSSHSDGSTTLTVDESSGLVSEHPPGVAFFDRAGEMTDDLRQVRNFLRLRAAAERAARHAAAELSEAGLLCPMPVAGVGGSGLTGIDDTALQQLAPNALGALWRSGALRLALAHRISLHHMKWLTQARTTAPDPAPPRDISGFLTALARAGALG